jgi:hypothetical protein
MKFIIISASVNGVACRTAYTTAQVDFAQVCSGNYDWCVANSELRNSILGAEFISSLGIDSNSSSFCDYCSGLGECNGVECECYVPNSGAFKGIRMVKGVGCDQVREKVALSTYFRTVGIGITTLSLLVCVGGLLFYVIKRDHPVIKASMFSNVCFRSISLAVFFSPDFFFVASFFVFIYHRFSFVPFFD